MTLERQPKISDPNLAIHDLLSRSPSGPNFAQSTISYCDQAILATTTKLRLILLGQFANSREPMSEKLRQIETGHRRLPKSSLVVKDGQGLFLEFPNGKIYPANRLVEVIYSVDPKLGILDYIVALFPTKHPKYKHLRFPWFNQRLTKIAEMGELRLDDPKIKYLAVAYVTQAAKALTVDQTRELLEKAQLFGGVTTAEHTAIYLDRIAAMVNQIRTHELFISTGLVTMDTIAKGAGLDEEKTQLLLDLAFIRNRAFDQPAEFKQVFDPLITLVAADRWEEAFLHRDFLLEYFSFSFPIWRRRGYFTEAPPSVETFGDLAKAIAQGNFVIRAEDIPIRYKDFFAASLPRRVKKAQKEIASSGSLGLSNAIVKELAVETARMMNDLEISKALKKLFRRNAEKVRAIITDPAKSRGEKDDAFLDLMAEINPKATMEHSDKLFDYLFELLNSLPTIPQKPPYVLRCPEEKVVLGVEIMENEDRQACWYGTDYLISARGKGKIQERARNRMDFGRLLRALIILAHKQPEGKIALDSERVKASLQRAYQKEKGQNPSGVQFTLVNYLQIMLDTAKSKTNPSDNILISNFIKGLE